MLADLAFQYPLKLMSPKIPCSDASLSPGLVSIYMLTYGALRLFCSVQVNGGH